MYGCELSMLGECSENPKGRKQKSEQRCPGWSGSNGSKEKENSRKGLNAFEFCWNKQASRKQDRSEDAGAQGSADFGLELRGSEFQTGLSHSFGSGVRTIEQTQAEVMNRFRKKLLGVSPVTSSPKVDVKTNPNALDSSVSALARGKVTSAVETCEQHVGAEDDQAHAHSMASRFPGLGESCRFSCVWWNSRERRSC